ncbi:MAG TPA: TldD/PmbA family protein, partial [Bacteroidota bacterium]
RLDLAQWVIRQTKAGGAEQVAVFLSNSRQVEVEYRDKKLDKLIESTRNSMSLQIYSGKRYSAHSTNDLRRDALQKFIDEALRSTTYLTVDEFRSLPDPKYYPAKMDRDLKVHDTSYESLDSPGRIKMAAAIEGAAMGESSAIISTTAGYSDSHDEWTRVHSNGLVAEDERTSFSAGAEVTVKDAEGGRPEDWEYATTCFYTDLPDPVWLGKSAARRAVRKMGQKKIKSGRYTMVVENRAGSRLISLLTSPMSAGALQQKRSWLDGMLGKKIASERLTIIDDPFLEKGLASRQVDGEGMAAQKRTMIEKGVLQQYYVDNYYGKKLGMQPTTGGSSNLLLASGTRSADEIIKGVPNGILVNGFLGGNFNSTTGDFSFGIVGALIENGTLTTPLHEMNLSGNAREFWGQLADIGNDPYPYSNWRIPTLLFDGVAFSGL